MDLSNKKVEVQGPAVKEMQKKKSCLRQSCGKSCFFLILLFISFLAIIKFTASPSSKVVETPPKAFPKDIPMYSEERVDKITVSSENNSLLAKSAKIVPKFIIVSTHVVLGDNSPNELEGYLKVPEDIKRRSFVKQFIYLMRTPTKKQESRIEIKWNNLPADPEFITNYYKSSLENNEYSTNMFIDNQEKKRINFTKKKYSG